MGCGASSHTGSSAASAGARAPTDAADALTVTPSSRAAPSEAPSEAGSSVAPILVVTPRSRAPVVRRSSAEAAPLGQNQQTSVRLADARRTRSSDSHLSHSTDARSGSTVRLRDYWLGGSNDYAAAREMIGRDLDVVEQELHSYARNRQKQPARSGSHRAFFSIDEGNVQEEPPSEAAATAATTAHGAASARSALSFEWHNVLQRAVDQPPSTLPPLNLLAGATLAELGRFPRASEIEYVTTVSADNVADIIAGSIYFISHRWNSPESPDTDDNAQARLLIEWLDKEHGAQAWHGMYFWIDWSCM
jgi:hypothetical protein